MTKSSLKIFFLFLLAALTLVQVVCLLSYYLVIPKTGAASAASVSEPVAIKVSTSFPAIDLGVAVARVRPAVVYITGHPATATSSPPPGGTIAFTPASLPGDKMGSGMIIDPAGYILTNHHVASVMTDIRVSLFGHQEGAYAAEIVALDASKDLAVIKINTGSPLPVVTLGNSDLIETADEVLAVGCPFSLEQSVSHGIISDTKRTVNIDGRDYVDLIQTDAAVNSGNSGGPLINVAGEVIGINVAIFAPNRVYCGVGFAIPVNQAKSLLRKIKY
ncbi:MAG TPA: trypsin-like serine protease [Deltaproteobacteria bacterium]|nr:trypsin-like serine protease [Deltaproteobacteria bacterium]